MATAARAAAADGQAAAQRATTGIIFKPPSQPDANVLLALGLRWYKEWQMLLCVKCQSSVTLQNLKRHWQDYQCAHPAASIASITEALNGVAPINHRVVALPDAHAEPIDGLPMLRGSRCTSCRYASATEQGVISHIQTEHGCGSMCPATLQRWSVGGSWFEVERSARDERQAKPVAARPAPPSPQRKQTSSLHPSAKRIALAGSTLPAMRLSGAALTASLSHQARLGLPLLAGLRKSGKGLVRTPKLLQRQADRSKSGKRLQPIVRGHNTRHYAKVTASIKKFADMSKDAEFRKMARNAAYIHRVSAAPKLCATADQTKLIKLTKRANRPPIRPELTIDSVMPARGVAPLSSTCLSLVVPLERENEGDVTFSWKGPQSWAATISELESRESISRPINPLLPNASTPKPMLDFDFSYAPKPKRLDKQAMRARARGAIRTFDAVEIEPVVRPDDGFARYSTYRDVPAVPEPAEPERPYGESLYTYKNKQMRRGISPALPLTMDTPCALSMALGLHPCIQQPARRKRAPTGNPAYEVDSASSVASSPDTSPVLRTVELEEEAAGQSAAATEPAAAEAAASSSASTSRTARSPSPLADVPAPEAAASAPFSPFGEGAAAVAPTSASSVWQPERSQSSEKAASTELASEQIEQSKANAAPLEPPEPANDAAQQQPSNIAADEVQPAVEDQVVRSLRITLAERAAPRKQRTGVVGSSPSLLKRASERGSFSPRKRADIKAKAQRASPIKVHFTPGPVA